MLLSITLVSLLCSHPTLLLLTQAVGTPGWSRAGLYLLPSLHSRFAATRVISFKGKQGGSRARFILTMDFAVRWSGSGRARGGKETSLTVCTDSCGNAHMRVHMLFLPKHVLLLPIAQSPRLSRNQTCCKAPCNACSFPIKFDER